MSDEPKAGGHAEQKEQQLRHLAHELRNCLHAIRSGINILTSTPPATQKQAPVCKLMEKECQRASQLLDDLLEIAQSERESQ